MCQTQSVTFCLMTLSDLNGIKGDEDLSLEFTKLDHLGVGEFCLKCKNFYLDFCVFFCWKDLRRSGNLI